MGLYFLVMGTILDLKEVVEVFNAKQEILDGIANNSDVAVEMNKSQLERGKTSDDDNVSPSYFSSFYASMKNRINSLPPMGVPDLLLTGDFHKGFYLDLSKVNQGIFEIDSTDWKTSELTSKYGESIFGLTDENEDVFFNETVMDYFSEQVLNKIGLTLQNV